MSIPPSACVASIIKNAALLSSPSKNNALGTIQRDFDTLNTGTQNILKQLEAKNQTLSNARIATEQTYTQLSQRQNEAEKKLRDLEAHLQGLNHKKSALNTEISSLNAKMGKLSSDISHEETIRHNAMRKDYPDNDLGQVVESFNFLRGIFSWLGQDKEEYEIELKKKTAELQNLTGQANSTTLEIQTTQGLVQSTRSELSRLKAQLDQNEIATRESTKNLTESRDLALSLSLLTNKYTFLKLDVDLIEPTQTDSFIQTMEKIQQSFNALLKNCNTN